MKKYSIIFATVLAGAMVMMTGCPEPNPSGLVPPSVTTSITSDQGGVKFEWDAVTDADGYIVKYNGKADTITATSYTVTAPTNEVEITAYNDNGESNPYKFDCGAKETQNVKWYTRADTDPGHPSGLGFDNSGNAVTISYVNGDHHDIDFVADNDNTIAGIQAVDNSIGYSNAVAYNSSWDYNKMDIAPSTGYTSYDDVVNGGTFALLRDHNGTKDTEDHFAKLLVSGVAGTEWTVQVTYQPIGGLRWLVK